MQLRHSKIPKLFSSCCSPTNADYYSDDSEDNEMSRNRTDCGRSNGSSVDNEEYAAALDALNIDDYDVWSSFRSSASVQSRNRNRSSTDRRAGRSDVGRDADDELSEAGRAEIERWKKRIDRIEVYRRDYVPTPTEEKEVHDLADVLGVTRPTPHHAVLGTKMGMLQTKKPPIVSVFHPEQGEPRSVLLKRGPVLLQQENSGLTVACASGGGVGGTTNVWGGGGDGSVFGGSSLIPKNGDGREEERELILLTNALVVATVEHETPPSMDKNREGAASGGGGKVSMFSPKGMLAAATSLPMSTGKGLLSAADNAGKSIVNATQNPGKTFVDAGNSASKTIASAVSVSSNAVGKTIISPFQKLIIKRKFESCLPLVSILAVMDLGVCSPVSLDLNYSANVDEDDEDEEEEYDRYDETSFRLLTTSPGCESIVSYTFICATKLHKEAWMHALTASVLSAHHRLDRRDAELGHGNKRPNGWMHQLMRTTIYSAAVNGDADMLHKMISESRSKKSIVNAFDVSGYAASHYAAMTGHNSCLAVLLDAGANPNAKDVGGMTPSAYASQQRNRRALEMLEANGAKLSRDEKNVLTKETNEVIAKTTRRKQTDIENDAGVGVGNAMSENVSRMKERGEKLRGLDKKTTDMKDEAVNFKDMATQLKKKTKEESKIFGLF